MLYDKLNNSVAEICETVQVTWLMQDIDEVE